MSKRTTRYSIYKYVTKEGFFIRSISGHVLKDDLNRDKKLIAEFEKKYINMTFHPL